MGAPTKYSKTNADRTRWQASALRLLDDLWHRGAAAGLPPLMWSLGGQGVAGHASDLHGDGAATLQAWADLLGLEVVDVTTAAGTRRRWARAERFGGIDAGLLLSVDLLDVVGEVSL